MPWYSQHVDPWRDVGVTRLLVDHVPKQKKDRPRGGIGSQHKLAMIDGAALYVSGEVWTKKRGGRFILTNHKDRQGDLPAPAGQQVAVVTGDYRDVGGQSTFRYQILTPSDAADNSKDAEIMRRAFLQILYEAAPKGVIGLGNLREMVAGNNAKKGVVLAKLVEAEYVFRDMVGNAQRYTLTGLGVAEIPGVTIKEPDTTKGPF